MSEPADELAALVARWLNWASEDLALARSAQADATVVPRGACAWAHQCAEKALKAAIVACGVDPPRTHSLLRLEALVAGEMRAALAAVDLAGLTRWSIEGRYPDELDEATTADATAAVEAAAAVLEIVRAGLAGGGGRA